MNIDKFNDRQKEIIKFAEEQESFQTKNVLIFLKNKFDVERLTIIRDLSLLTEEKILLQSGRGRSVSYRISLHYLSLKKIDVDQYFSLPSNARGAKPLFSEQVIDLFTIDIFTKEELKKLRKISKRYSEVINSLEKKSPTILKKEWERLIIDLSWKSSEIEGNTYTLLETEFLIKDLAFAKGRDRTEAQMILNHKKTLDYILLNPNYLKKVSVKKILGIHELLVRGIDIKTNFRNHPVGITGTIYRPLAKNDAIEKVIKKLVNNARKIENPFLKAFMFLVMIAYIQPFEDGNKRTSRIVTNAILHSNQIPMLSYRNVEAVEYKKAMLLFFEQNNISYIKNIFIEQMEFSAENYFE